MNHFENYFLKEEHTRQEIKEGLDIQAINNLITYGNELIKNLHVLIQNTEVVPFMDVLRAKIDLPIVEQKLKDLAFAMATIQKFELVRIGNNSVALFMN